MFPTEPVAISFDERLSRSADDIGHLEKWPAHLLAWQLDCSAAWHRFRNFSVRLFEDHPVGREPGRQPEGKHACCSTV